MVFGGVKMSVSGKLQQTHAVHMESAALRREMFQRPSNFIADEQKSSSAVATRGRRYYGEWP